MGPDLRNVRTWQSSLDEQLIDPQEQQLLMQILHRG